MTFSLRLLTDVLPLSTAWLTTQTTQAAAVIKARAYFDGDHDASYLTDEMKKLLRLSSTTSIPFAANYCKVIVNTFVDRLNVTGIRTDSDAVNEWIADLLIDNRFDAMQTQVHGIEANWLTRSRSAVTPSVVMGRVSSGLHSTRFSTPDT